MQKWEYRILGFHVGDKKSGYTIDGRMFEYAYSESTADNHAVLTFKTKMLNSMGDEGWELVSDGGVFYTFKRPK